MPALSYAEYLMVLSKIETMMDALHVRVGGLANYHASKQKVQPSPANGALVAVLRYEAEALGQTRARIDGYRREATAASSLADAEFDTFLRSEEDRVSTSSPASSVDNTVDYFTDMHESDIFRITGHGDTTPESRAA